MRDPPVGGKREIQKFGAGGEGSGDHGFDLAVCAGHLTGWQGALTPPFIAP